MPFFHHFLAHLTKGPCEVLPSLGVRRPSVNFFIFLSSPLKQLVQMEPNLEVSIYVKSSIKFFHFVPFHQQIWPPRAFLVPDWLLFKKIFSSETAWPNGAKLGRKHLCKILYKVSAFHSVPPTNMAAKGNSCF